MEVFQRFLFQMTPIQNNILMKNIFFICVLISNFSFGQDAKPIKIFKFHPFSLATGSLSVSQEKFNKEATKSTIVGLGLRYINSKSQTYLQNPGFSEVIPQFNKWQGATLSLERRIYVPGFFGSEKNKFLNDDALFGVYFSGGAKVEYNVNTYDNSRVNYVNEPNSSSGKQVKVIDTGTKQYIGVLPNLNMGVQFTLFQNLYTDIQIGGAIRFLSAKTLKSKQDILGDSYYYNGLNKELIGAFVVKEGVQANFNFGLGLRL